LVAWLAFPKEWRIVLVLPPWQPGIHGLEERQAFGELQEIPGRAEVLCRLLLMEVIPALSGDDFAAFSESLHHFNRLAGEAFATIQGGPYANARVAELIAFLRGLGVKGVGQSSWGPAVFALAEDRQRAGWLVGQVRDHYGLTNSQVWSVSAGDGGAKVGEA
jgi:predicted sugar kinase